MVAYMFNVQNFVNFHMVNSFVAITRDFKRTKQNSKVWH